MTGATWARIGQHARALHATQGMGYWPGAEHDFPLHLVGGPSEAPVTDALPATLADLGVSDGAQIQRALDRAIAAFPVTQDVITQAATALRLLRHCRPNPVHAHRIEAKIAQLCRVLYLASGADVRAAATEDWLRPDERFSPVLETYQGRMTDLAAQVRGPSAGASDGYQDRWHPLAPPPPAIDVSGTVGDQKIEVILPLDRTPALRGDGVRLAPGSDIINLATGARRTDVHLAPEAATLTLPPGWQKAGETIITDGRAGHHDLPVTLVGAPGFMIEPITAPTSPRAS